MVLLLIPAAPAPASASRTLDKFVLKNWKIHLCPVLGARNK